MKTVLITGCSSGYGLATARHFHARGWTVIATLRTPRDEVLRPAERLRVLPLDVTRADSIAAVVAEAGPIDVLVNNAGIGPISRIDDLCVDDWDEMIDVNLKGTLYGIAAALPVFRRQGGGHVVNVVSTSGLKIVPLQGVYAATKNAVRTLSEALRQETVEGLRVTNVSPGMVRTGFADSMTDPVVKAAINERMDRMAISPEAIARAIAFAIEQPADVEVGDIVIRPTVQD